MPDAHQRGLIRQALMAGLDEYTYTPEEFYRMTTDPEQGVREVEQATQQHEFKVGDRVRLKAGGPIMAVVAVEDYGNQIVCEVERDDERVTHSRASLVPVE